MVGKPARGGGHSGSRERTAGWPGEGGGAVGGDAEAQAEGVLGGGGGAGAAAGQVLAPGVKTMGVVARRSSGRREAAFEIFAARRISE